jgi:hypothetical protein
VVSGTAAGRRVGQDRVDGGLTEAAVRLGRSDHEMGEQEDLGVEFVVVKVDVERIFHASLPITMATTKRERGY